MPLENKIIDFARETYSGDLVSEMMPLWKEHYKEIALYKDVLLSPLLAVYSVADKSDMLRIYTARHKRELVGYHILYVQTHPHFSEMKVAIQDTIFLCVEFRKGMIGYQFLKWSDEQLKNDGVKIVYQKVEQGHDFSALLKRLGYVDHEITYSRRLE